MDADTIARLRGEVARVDDVVRIPQHLDPIAQRGIANRHKDRQESQANLRDAIAMWAGVLKSQGRDDSEIYRRFYFRFGTDVMSAQTLGANAADDLYDKIYAHIDELINTG